MAVPTTATRSRGRLPSRRARRTFTLPLAACLLAASNGGAQSLELDLVQPRALAPGARTLVRLIGKEQGDSRQLWLSAATELLKAGTATDDASEFAIEMPPEPAWGIVAARLISTRGLSPLHLLVVDPLPTTAATGTNTAVASAQPVEAPIAVEGRVPELGSQFFRVHLGQQQTIRVETVAHRLGSPLDPFLRVLDPSGRELAAVDDTPGCAADARIEFTAPVAGDFLVELRDTRYQGGDGHFYRLRFGGAAEGPLRMQPLADPVPAAAAAVADTLRDEDEDEGDDGDDAGLHAGIWEPVIIRGRFQKAGDRDTYRFRASRDARWIVRGRTRSLGSPCDLTLRWEQPDGTLLAEADPRGPDEGSLTFTFKESGPVRLVVGELNGGGGPGFEYELEVRAFVPGFTLAAEKEAVEIAPGTAAPLKITCRRFDYDGPIRLALAGSAAGLSLTNQVIGARTNEVTLTITAAGDALPGSARLVALIGEAGTDEQRFTTRASTLSALKEPFRDLLHPPAALDGLITIGIKAP